MPAFVGNEGIDSISYKKLSRYDGSAIMREVAKWKALFFPKQMVQKYIAETQSY